MSEPFRAFDDDRSLGIGRLTIENSADRVALYGDVDFHVDALSLQRARELKAVVDSIIASLEHASTLPTRARAAPIQEVRNPFRGENSGEEGND